MRAHLLLIPLLLVGCIRAQNTFEVSAPGAVSAELQLCAKTTRLTQSGELFTGARAIDCEGRGAITVRFADGPPVSCLVGYVTPGAAQSFRFKVAERQCS